MTAHGPANELRAANESGLRTHRVFAHVLADKALLYRAVLTMFVRSREQFIIHLRPGEVAAELEMDDASVEEALKQLAHWGNLESTQDAAAVATVEEFYRTRYLYQLSEAGEAAERALAVFEETLRQPGELQTAALRDIADFLEALRILFDGGEPDAVKLHTQLLALTDRFQELTSRAQAFMRSLQSTIDLHGVSVEQFLEYKQLLIDYLERFLSELVLATNEISDRILALEHVGIQAQFRRVADRALIDALERTAERDAEELARWSGRWSGLRRWFLGDQGGVSQAEILRARAREAIPALLFTLQNINDQRVSRSDRFADWQTLALWFAEAPSEEESHQLWRAAFGMASARHLQINQETIERRDQFPENARTSWLDSEPLWFNPRLQRTGRTTGRGPVSAVEDRSEAKRALAELAAEENRQIERALETLALGRRMRLSDLGTLDPSAFELLLDLLGQATAERTALGGPVDATSTDGALSIRLEPAPEFPEGCIQTTWGVLRGPEYWVTIRAAHQAALQA